jgi:hypothetical protein
MLRRVRRYAGRIAASVAEAGGLGGDDGAEELVQECLADTIAGDLTWDPAVATLESHLMSRIRARGRDERRRARQHPHASMDEACDEGEDGATVLEEVEEALGQRQRQRDTTEDHARRRMLQLREHAAEDPDLRAILDAVDEGAEGKAEILAATGLPENAYRNARLRLRRLGDRILDVSSQRTPDEVTS